MPTANDLRSSLSFAIEAARAAGELTLRHFQSPGLRVERKRDASPVTAADRGAERVLRDRISASFPGDGIVGEEYGSRAGSTGRTWYLDPIDGTVSFVRGVPLYGTMVGLETDGDMALGVVYMPALREIYFAAKGLGAWWARDLPGLAEGGGFETTKARVSQTSALAEACFCATSVGTFAEAGRLHLYERLRSAARVDRCWSDCYGHMLVATGRVDLMVDPVMSVWDCAALKPIVEEAGGTFTDLAGKPTAHGGSAVSTNGLLHAAVLQALRGPH